jgi:hypothetical protein
VKIIFVLFVSVGVHLSGYGKSSEVANKLSVENAFNGKKKRRRSISENPFFLSSSI